MNAIVIIVAVVTLLLLAVFLGHHFSRDEITKRRLRIGPRLPIDRYLEGGCWRVVGRVAYSRDPLAAPLSGHPCTYFQVIVSKQKGGDAGTYWDEIINENRGEDFLLDDGTVTCLH